MTPATLAARVAAVCAARGEGPDALRPYLRLATRGYPRGRRWHATVAAEEPRGTPPAWADHTWGATAEAACDEAWAGFVVKLRARLVDAAHALSHAEERHGLALAGLAAARAFDDAPRAGGSDD